MSGFWFLGENGIGILGPSKKESSPAPVPWMPKELGRDFFSIWGGCCLSLLWESEIPGCCGWAEISLLGRLSKFISGLFALPWFPDSPKTFGGSIVRFSCSSLGKKVLSFDWEV